MSTSGGNDKASFTNLDTGDVVQVQFNPKDFTLSDSAAWKARGNVARPALTYEKGMPASVRMTLFFDTTRGGRNVETEHVGALRALLEQTETETVDGAEVSRPPILQFAWGSFRFQCVLEKIDVQYMMFKPDGTPVRAQVSVTLMEHQGVEAAGGSSNVTLATMGGAVPATAMAATRTVTVTAGQTVSTLAQQHGSTFQAVARANRLADPFDVAPGTQLVIPGSDAVASAMEAAGLQEVASSWTSSGSNSPFDDLGDFTDELASVFEDAVDDLGAELNAVADALGDELDTAVDDAASAVTDTVEGALERAEEAVDGIADRAEEAVDEIADRAEEAVDEIADRAEEAVDEIADRAEEAVDEIADRAEEAVDEIADRAEEAVDEIADRAEEAADEIADRAEEAADEIADRAEEAVDHAAERAEEAADTLGDRAKDLLGGDDA